MAANLLLIGFKLKNSDALDYVVMPVRISFCHQDGDIKMYNLTPDRFMFKTMFSFTRTFLVD